MDWFVTKDINFIDFDVVFSACLRVWLWLLFKVFFTQKNMPIMFFYFLKIIFEINT